MEPYGGKLHATTRTAGAASPSFLPVRWTGTASGNRGPSAAFLNGGVERQWRAAADRYDLQVLGVAHP
jgi:hypothetical protein